MSFTRSITIQEQNSEQQQYQKQNQFAHAERVQNANKLTRDVYMALGAMWNKPMFDNVAAAESCYVTEVNQLMVRNGLDQLSGKDKPGVLADQEFSRRYAEFTQRAATSLHAAFLVTWELEEIRLEGGQSQRNT